MGNYAEAATTVEQLIAKYPDAKSVRTLVFLADYHRRAGHIEAAKATLREAMKLDPGDGESQLLLADVLREIGQIDDAIQILRNVEQERAQQPDLRADPGGPALASPIATTRRSRSSRTC